MALQLTRDELREVSLAIVAYKETLDRYDSGTIKETVRLLESARAKIVREWSHTEVTVKAMSAC